MGSEARARLGLAAVLGMTLFAFGGLFAPGDYYGPGLLAILIAGALAMGARRLGIGTLLTTAASAAVLIVYTVFVFANDLTFYGLPTPVAITDVIDAVSRALVKAETDAAPVPVRVGYVVMMVVGLWAVTTIGELATFRWKRPVVAVVPAIGLVSLLIVVGVNKGGPERALLFLAALVTYWGLESSHRLRSWGRWVPTWAGIDDDKEPRSVTGGIARRLGATCVLVAVASPLFMPAFGDGLLSWRSGSGDGSGSGRDGGGSIDPFVSLAPNLLEQSETTLFRVSSTRPAYWRLLTLPHFDGTTWRASPLPGDPIGGSDIPDDAEVDVPLQELIQNVTIASLEGSALPAAPQPTSISGAELGDGVRYRASGDLLYDDVHSGLSYTVVSRVPGFGFEDLRDAEIGAVPSFYETLPRGLSPEVQALRDQWTLGADTPYERLVAIQQNLRGPEFTYSTQPAEDDAERGASSDYLTTFLTQSRTGYCQQFSAAFAILARSFGYPTRVVIGFLPGQRSGEAFAVSGADAHAWPEVYFDEFGWVAFEPTPRADGGGRSAAAPTYTLPSVTGAGPEANRGGAGGDPAGPSVVEAREGIPGGAGRAQLPRGQANPAGADDPLVSTEWQRAFTRLAVTLVVLGILFLSAVPALKTLRIRRLYARAADSRDRAAAAFEEFLLEASELASARGPAESANAYVRRLLRMKPLPEQSALGLAAIYDQANYGRRDLPDAEAARARSLARELRAQLWSRATWWQRAGRLFSPASLARR